MSKFNINGMNFNGNTITISNNKVIVNGQDVTPDAKEINITVEGNIEKIEAEYCNKINVTGEVGNIKTMSGDIEINGNVKGSIQTMSGSVGCRDVSGSISSMSGNINKYK